MAAARRVSRICGRSPAIAEEVLGGPLDRQGQFSRSLTNDQSSLSRFSQASVS